MIIKNFANALDKIVQHLRDGELVAIPTETVYGLAGDASNPEAIKKIFALKQRPLDNPLIVHVENAEAMTQWASPISSSAKALAKFFWPGPLTLILPKAPHVSDLLTASQPSVGLRVPSHPIALEILKAFGGGLAAPSANPFMRISPTTAAHVESFFPDDLWIVDGGETSVGLESTIIDCTVDPPALLRHGMISPEDVLEKTGIHLQLKNEKNAKHAGQFKKHYAPLTSLVLLDSQQLNARWEGMSATEKNHAGLVLIENKLSKAKHRIVLSSEPNAYARQLYAALHEMDASACNQIFLELPPDLPEWAAVRERLFKAAG